GRYDRSPDREGPGDAQRPRRRRRQLLPPQRAQGRGSPQRRSPGQPGARGLRRRQRRRLFRCPSGQDSPQARRYRGCGAAARPDSSAAMSSADEQMGWAVNNVALAMHQAGRGADADALFALLNEAPAENAGWRVSMIINRLELLVSDGKFDEAARLLDTTEAFT